MCFIRPEFHQETKSSGGIWLTKQAYRGLPNTGVIHAMPDGKHEFCVGDRVLYDDKKSSIDVLKHDGKPLAVVPVDAVMAILK